MEFGASPFAWALVGVVAIALLEAVSMLLGHALSHVFDHAADSLHLDADGAGGVLDWLSVGRVPTLVLLILFLSGFGFIGLGAEALLHPLLGASTGTLVALAPALLGGLLAMAALGRAVGRLLPREETAAIGRSALVGRLATVTRGHARRGLPAEARVRDEHGTSHYILVEPDHDGDVFGQGASVLILAVEGHKAIVAPAP